MLRSLLPIVYHLVLVFGIGLLLLHRQTSVRTPVDTSAMATWSRVEAVGDLRGLSAIERAAFDPRSRRFGPVRSGRREESGDVIEPQSHAQFLASRPHRPTEERRSIVLLPLELGRLTLTFPIETLKSYAEIFTGLDVQLAPAARLDTRTVSTRINRDTGRLQVLSTDLLDDLACRLPDDAYSLAAITGLDLYPEPGWSFVYGQARLFGRVGVHSLARHDPRFFGRTPVRGREELVLGRSLKVLTHELVHMFGVRHCVYFGCLMNATRGEWELDRRPFFLCPVCLRKLHGSVGFDVVDRYQRLRAFFRAVRFVREVGWLDERLSDLAPSN